MRKRLLQFAEMAATAAGHVARNVEGITGAALAVVGTVELTGQNGWGFLVAAAFLLLRDATK